MTVYVDNAQHRVGRFTLGHMLADTPAELHHMAEQLGLKPRWYQQPRPGIRLSVPHYDVCAAKRRQAVELGAKRVDRRELAAICQRIRRDMEDVATAIEWKRLPRHQAA